jgi:type IV secretion system protein VirB8
MVFKKQKKDPHNLQDLEQQANKKKKLKKKNNVKSWYASRYQIVAVQRNILFLFTVLLLIGMVGATVFVKMVVSSKSLEPYIIEVEEKTGIATVVDQLSSENLTGDEAVKKYFVNQYIQSAVAYDPRTYRNDANRVRLLSSQTIYSDFRKRIKPKKLGTDSKISLRIKTMRFPKPNVAHVRVLRQINENGKVQEKNEIIIMNFYFANLKLTAEERFINPLGFQVVNFTIAEEISNY